MFNALRVHQTEAGVALRLESISEDALSAGDVLIRPHYSAVNYKDMLACQVNGGVIRQYPMIPGIDVSGEVVSVTGETSLVVGDRVVVTGHQFGVSHTGGYAERVRVPQQWVTKLPDSMSTRTAMVYGTAGLTAAHAVRRLLAHGMSVAQQPHIVVTGATGGVGSIVISLLHHIGFQQITAVTRKLEQSSYLRQLGAREVLHTDVLCEQGQKPLATATVNYAVDTIGGEPLAALLAQMGYGGAIALCGNAGGIRLQTTVLPFILRGVDCLGIDTVQLPVDERDRIWQEFSERWAIADKIRVSEVPLTAVADVVQSLRKGTHIGRTIVSI